MFMGNAVYCKSLKSWWVTGWMTALFFASATACLQSYFCMYVHTNTDAQKNLKVSIPFPVESRLLQNHLFYEWVRLQTLGAKSAEKTIRNTGHSCSRQPAETDKHKEDELREYRRDEMKTKIETWKCFVPAINKFGHVYILSYPCHVKIITSLRTLWHKISSMLAKRFLGSLLLIKHHKEKTNENSE